MKALHVVSKIISGMLTPQAPLVPLRVMKADEGNNIRGELFYPPSLRELCITPPHVIVSREAAW